MHGSKMQDVDCGRGDQQSDSEIVIGDPANKALALPKPDHQKPVMFGISASFSISVDYLQSRLPLQNALLRTLRCLNPQRRTIQSSVKTVETLAWKLKSESDVSQVYGEWRVSSCDTNVAQIDAEERVDHFWRAVFCLKSSDESPKYMVLPEVVKAGLILAQTNAESERSLSVNARIMTKEHSFLEETTTVGLKSVTEAVRFQDPQHSWSESVPIIKDMKVAVRSVTN